MMGILGEGINRASIYTRDGRTRLLDLPATSLDWARGLCQTTQGTAVVAAADCDQSMTKIATWAHTLVMHRDRDRVWEGPVRKIIHTRTGLTVAASDVTGYMQRRRIRTARRLTGVRVMDEMEWTVGAAFATDDPNVLSLVQVLGADLGESIDRDLAVASAYHADDLGTLAGAGGRWTTLGRAILLWPDTFTTNVTRDLFPENHLDADVSVTEDGDDLATLVAARNDNGVLATAGSDVDTFYGQVDALASASAATPAALQAYADAQYRQSYPARLTIDLPSDAALRPDAPFPMSDLIAGSLVPVQTVTATAKVIRTTMVLTGVKVTQAAGSPEKVSITLALPSEASE